MKTFINQCLRDPKLYQYIMVGGFAAIIDLALFFTLKNYLAFHYLIIATISFIFATMINFLLCNFYVFKFTQKRSTQSRLLLTYLVSAVGLTIHHSCLLLAFEFVLLPLILSKIFAMGAAFGWNFLSRKYLVFKAA